MKHIFATRCHSVSSSSTLRLAGRYISKCSNCLYSKTVCGLSRSELILQRHFWLDQFTRDTHGPSTIAFDPVNGHIALHKDGPEKTVQIICSHKLLVIDTLVVHADQAVNGDTKHPSVWQMSFSSDGINLVVGVRSDISELWVFSRSSPSGSFVHMCSQRVDVVSRTNPPSFSPVGNDNLCWIGLLSCVFGCTKWNVWTW